MPKNTLILKKNEDRRLLAGHLWVYSNEIDNKRTPLKDFEPGDQVEIKSSNGRSIGKGYINPHSLICARLYSRRRQDSLNTSLLAKRLTSALELRISLFQEPFYRLVYGEADALPGLIVDRYDQVLVVQITTVGMEKVKSDITQALSDLLKPQVIIFKNDSSMRQVETLDSYIETALGTTPDVIGVTENHTQFEFDIMHSQKTGWYYDHRFNRARTQHYAKGRRVLDVFSYLGAWGIEAASAGAVEVICIDSSQVAIAALKRNAELNGVSDKVSAFVSDAFDGLKSLDEQSEKFDVVIVDPPAFIKRKKDHRQGLDAYRRINKLALQLLNDQGVLISSSCSYHLQRTELLNSINKANNRLAYWLQLIEQGHQAPDHPIHPAIAETEYIKTLFCRKSGLNHSANKV